jgi:hypothetical protein
MQLPGTDVGPIRYRDAEPAGPAVAAPPGAEASRPAAAAPSPAAAAKRGISGVRYADEEAEEPSQDLTKDAADIPGVRFHRSEDGDRLPPGVRYVEPLVRQDAETRSPEDPPGAAVGHAVLVEVEPARTPDVAVAVHDVVAEPAFAIVETAEDAETAEGEDEAESAAPSRSIASHRQKLATTGVFAVPGGAQAPAAVRPPKPKPRPAKAKDIQDALKGLFSSLPWDELPPPLPTSLSTESTRDAALAAVPVVEEPAPEPPGQLPLFVERRPVAKAAKPEPKASPPPPAPSKVDARPARAKAVAPGPAAPRPAALAAASRSKPEPKPEAKTVAKANGKVEAKTNGKHDGKPNGKHDASPKHEPKPRTAPPGRFDSLFVSAVEAALERGAASLVLLQRRFGIGYARASTLMDALAAEGIVGETTASGSRPTTITAAEWSKRRQR